MTAIDYVPALLKRAHDRAEAERFSITFREADPGALPFSEESFDAVVSTFGVMFTPDQERAAAELVRVCRRGGRIGLANWTPDGFIGQVFKIIGRHVPPPPGVPSPASWGTQERVTALFQHRASAIEARQRNFVLRYLSPEHWLEVFASTYGPMIKAFDALDASARAELRSDLLDLIGRFNLSAENSMVVTSTYLESIVRLN